MRPTSVILNVLWIVFGGFWTGVAWLVASLVMAITIIGLPWARAAFNIGIYSLFPFGRTAVRRDQFVGQSDFGTGPFGFIGNVVWFLLVGWILVLVHLATALMLAVTIIGLPFAWAHLKLAGISVAPIGYRIVDA